MLYFLFFEISFLSILCSFILFFFNKVDKHASRLLAMGLLSASTTLVLNGLTFFDGFYVSFPYLYKMFFFTHYSAPPLFYLYVRATINRECRFSKWDWLHFLPALLHFIEFIPFYLMPIDEKRRYVRFVFSHIELITKLSEGLLSSFVHDILKISTTILYLFLQLRILFFAIKNKREWVKKNKLVWKWIIFSNTSISLSVISIFYFIIFKREVDVRLYPYLVLAFIHFLYLIVLIFLPSILYGIDPTIEKIRSLGNIIMTDVNKKFILSIEKREQYKQKLEAFIENERPYLKKKYSIREFSIDCGIPMHHLSTVINEDYGCVYTDFINKYRVNFIITNRYKGHWSTFSIEGLASEAGFNSRNSFLIAFKKATGYTPSVYFAKYKTVEANNFIKT